LQSKEDLNVDRSVCVLAGRRGRGPAQARLSFRCAVSRSASKTSNEKEKETILETMRVAPAF
jgi:hypothetical protein